MRYIVAAEKITINANLAEPIFFTGPSCGNLIFPNKYNTINRPVITHEPIKISLLIIPHWDTRSAFDKNLTAIASSKNPSTTFTDVSQPPDLGSECSHPGNIAN